MEKVHCWPQLLTRIFCILSNLFSAVSTRLIAFSTEFWNYSLPFHSFLCIFSWERVKGKQIVSKYLAVFIWKFKKGFKITNFQSLIISKQGHLSKILVIQNKVNFMPYRMSNLKPLRIKPGRYENSSNRPLAMLTWP